MKKILFVFMMLFVGFDAFAATTPINQNTANTTWQKCLNIVGESLSEGEWDDLLYQSGKGILAVCDMKKMNCDKDIPESKKAQFYKLLGKYMIKYCANNDDSFLNRLASEIRQIEKKSDAGILTILNLKFPHVNEMTDKKEFTDISIKKPETLWKYMPKRVGILFSTKTFKIGETVRPDHVSGKFFSSDCSDYGTRGDNYDAPNIISPAAEQSIIKYSRLPNTRWNGEVPERFWYFIDFTPEQKEGTYAFPGLLMSKHASAKRDRKMVVYDDPISADKAFKKLYDEIKTRNDSKHTCDGLVMYLAMFGLPNEADSESNNAFRYEISDGPYHTKPDTNREPILMMPPQKIEKLEIISNPLYISDAKRNK